MLKLSAKDVETKKPGWVTIPVFLCRAIAKQAEAGRECRAKVIHAEGEQQASQKLLEASQTLGQTAASDIAPPPANFN